MRRAVMIDAGGFEGNAQTLRILSCLEKKATEEYPPTAKLRQGERYQTRIEYTCRGLAFVRIDRFQL